MEKHGILGENLTSSPQDREKSATITAQAINNFNIGQVGALVQIAEHSLVQGGVGSTLSMTQDVRDLVQQIEQLLPAQSYPRRLHAK